MGAFKSFKKNSKQVDSAKEVGIFSRLSKYETINEKIKQNVYSNGRNSNNAYTNVVTPMISNRKQTVASDFSQKYS